MIVMIVTDENAIDRWKIVELHAGITMPTRSEKRQRANSLGPDGIGKNVEATCLQQESLVIDKGDDQVRPKHPLNGLRALRAVDEVRPIAPLAVRDPSQKRYKALARCTRVVKASLLAVV